MQSDVPERFGRYRVLSELGSGAMGAVFLGRDDDLDRDVAIKSLRPHPSISRDLMGMLRQRFEQEGRALAALAHPNVVRVFDVGSQDGTPFLVMERVAGPSLFDVLKEGPLSPAEVRRLGVQLARALEAAHAAGIVHRDLKPSNVLRSEEGYKLVDFGIARVPESSLTLAGQFVGTPEYAAPESLLQGKFSPASDVYGLGATLYAALCGTSPHGKGGLLTSAEAADRPVAPPRSIRSGVPDALDEAIVDALQEDPEARPSPGALAQALARGGPAADDPARDHGAPRRPSTASPLALPSWWPAAAVAALLAAALAGSVATSLWYGWNTEPPSDTPRARGDQERAEPVRPTPVAPSPAEREPWPVFDVQPRDRHEADAWERIDEALREDRVHEAVEELDALLHEDPSNEDARRVLDAVEDHYFR